MARTAAIADHLADGDRLLRAVHRRSDFAALKFAPAHILAVRAILAGPQRCAPCTPPAMLAQLPVMEPCCLDFKHLKG